jgi:hypothetical protein
MSVMNVRETAVAVVAVLGLSGCTTHHNSAAPKQSPTASTSASATPLAPVRVLASHAYAPADAPVPLRPHRAVMLAANRVEFEMGGSGSCPPVAASATISGDTLVIPVVPGGNGICTSDLRGYAVVVTLSAPVLAPNAFKSITSITVGYNPPRVRLPLVPA